MQKKYGFRLYIYNNNTITIFFPGLQKIKNNNKKIEWS